LLLHKKAPTFLAGASIESVGFGNFMTQDYMPREFYNYLLAGTNSISWYENNCVAFVCCAFLFCRTKM